MNLGYRLQHIAMTACRGARLGLSFGMGDSMAEDADDLTPRKLTHEQARMEQRLYWSRKSIPERLAAMTALTKRMNEMRGIFIDEQNPDLTPRRVRRSQDRADAEELALIPDHGTER
jgi:hypothetical protein